MPDAQAVRRLYVFGDSFSDTGAGSPLDIGPTAVAFMAGALGIDLQPARVGQIEPDSSVNFAAGGACSAYVMGMELGLRRFGHGLVNQISDFVEAVEQGTLRFQPQETLAFIAIGLNDGSLPSEATLTNILGSISRLIAAGVTNIQVARLPEAIPDFADTAKRLNPVIDHAVDVASDVHPRASVLVSEWGSYFDHVLENWKDYGFVEPAVPCAPGEVRLDQPLALTGDPKLHCYITQGHPSAVVHHIVGTRLAAALAYGAS